MCVWKSSSNNNLNSNIKQATKRTTGRKKTHETFYEMTTKFAWNFSNLMCEIRIWFFSFCLVFFLDVMITSMFQFCFFSLSLSLAIIYYLFLLCISSRWVFTRKRERKRLVVDFIWFVFWFFCFSKFCPLSFAFTLTFILFGGVFCYYCCCCFIRLRWARERASVCVRMCARWIEGCFSSFFYLFFLSILFGLNLLYFFFFNLSICVCVLLFENK